MKQITPLIVISVLTAAMLLGCGRSQPSRFYTLNNISGSAAPMRTESASADLVMDVGPISIPDYLERPQIVTRTSQNRIVLGEYDKWAGSLKENIGSVIAGNLSILLGTDMVSVFPKKSAGPSGYQVVIDFTRFDAEPAQRVWLDARWHIVRKQGGKQLATRRSRLDIRIDSGEYEAIVAGQSRLLERLSKEIAQTLTDHLAAGHGKKR